MAARVFASVLDWMPPPSPSDGELMVRVEYILLDGDRSAGKLPVTCSLLNERTLAQDLVDALVDYLNDLFPTAEYRARDVVLWGA